MRRKPFRMVLVEGCASERMIFLWRAWTLCEIRHQTSYRKRDATNKNFIEYSRSTKDQLTDRTIRNYVRVKPKLVNYYSTLLSYYIYDHVRYL